MSDSSKYTILVTRPVRQAEKLACLIEQQGWFAVRFPTLEIKALKSSKYEQQFALLSNYQWLIFISANAVNFAIKANNGKIDCFKQVSLVAIGKATEKALLSAGLEVDLLPDKSHSEGLLAMPEMADMTGKSCLIIRGESGRELLADNLKMRGATVEYLSVYQRCLPKIDVGNLSHLLQINQLNVITITSGEALNNLFIMLKPSLHPILLTIPLVVISERIKQLALTIGFKNIAVSDYPSDDAIIDTIVKLRNGEYSE